MKKKSNVIWWLASVFLLLLGLSQFPNFSSFLFIFAGLNALPPVFKFTSRFIKKRWIKVIAIILCFLFGCAVAPINSQPSQVSTTEVGPTSQPTKALVETQVPERTSATASTPNITSTITLPTPTPSQSPTNEPVSESRFEVLFLDVGQADAVVVYCDNQVMLIDGGNAEDSNLIYSYLKKHNINHINYIVCTHPHEDHVGGFAGALNYADVGIAYCPVTSYDSRAFNSFVKYLNTQGVSISIPSPGDIFKLGSATVNILSPQRSYSDTNNDSIVLKITYGETSFIFAGDAGIDAEHDIIDAGYNLSATVLKVGHHGSDTSTSYIWLREIMPQYAIISVGANNSYGHPSELVLSRLRDANVILYRTDMQGDILCRSDGKTVTFTVERNTNAETNPTLTSEDGNNDSSTNTPKPSQNNTPEPSRTDTPSSPSGKYIGNKNTDKFHISSCSYLPDEQNRVYFDTRDGAIAAGYVPCKKCNP